MQIRLAGMVTFHWANDGAATTMGPATRQETVRLSFLSNIHEPPVRRNRTRNPASATGQPAITSR
ncbi:hypothetical protein CCS01_13400 [Rhodopila globiformis]|uniref:Uncharacterized protein n=2 Tax=Rhodopila globiformis TaxID=1071 RepID=A0A2S6NGF1_RHOGL|nr:hypothetical protein CCS01_13400 [Rhodopila globiformis]